MYTVKYFVGRVVRTTDTNENDNARRKRQYLPGSNGEKAMLRDECRDGLPASDGLFVDSLGPGHIVERGFDVVRIRTIITIP